MSSGFDEVNCIYEPHILRFKAVDIILENPLGMNVGICKMFGSQSSLVLFSTVCVVKIVNLCIYINIYIALCCFFCFNGVFYKNRMSFFMHVFNYCRVKKKTASVKASAIILCQFLLKKQIAIRWKIRLILHSCRKHRLWPV